MKLKGKLHTQIYHNISLQLHPAPVRRQQTRICYTGQSTNIQMRTILDSITNIQLCLLLKITKLYVFNRNQCIWCCSMQRPNRLFKNQPIVTLVSSNCIELLIIIVHSLIHYSRCRCYKVTQYVLILPIRDFINQIQLTFKIVHLRMVPEPILQKIDFTN